MEKINKNKFTIFLIIVLIIKLIIVQVQPLNAQYAMKYDDQLMVEIAENIVNGKWLGEYNSKTLIKGVFTPLFISFLYILHIPFLMGKEIFYGIACILLIMVFNKKIKNKAILGILYIAILFNPVEYSESLSRVYRDEIYISLILYLLAFSFGIFFTRKENIKKQIKHFVGFGITLSAIYLCREENIWLVPFILFIFISTIIPTVKTPKNKSNFKRLLLYLIPLVIFVSSTNIVCAINYKYYGVYTLNQYWGKAFKSAYGALTRAGTEEKQRVPVTTETLQELYGYSSKLVELKDFFEGSEGEKWEQCGEMIEGEINGGYFHWALMDAVESKGYYENAQLAEQYYTELAEEINQLCDNNIIESKCGKRISNTCYFDYKDIIEVIKNIPQTIKYQYRLSEVKMTVSNPSSSIGIENVTDKINVMEKMTNHKIETVKHYIGKWNNIRLKIIEGIKDVYTLLNQYILYFSIGASIVFVIINIKKLKNIYEELIILGSLILMHLSRIFIVTFTSTMMFKEALNVEYLSSIYNIQYIFAILSLYFLLKNIKYLKKKDRKENGRINNLNTSIK